MARTTTDPDAFLAWPALSRFYGLSYSDIASMPRAMIVRYLEAIPTLRASEQLDAIEAASFPHIDEDSRASVLRRLRALTGAEEHVPKADPRILQGMGIKVVKQSA